ncbi:MAG: hypothetical protein U0165_04370 [Polyangiaceae bacterium]
MTTLTGRIPLDEVISLLSPTLGQEVATSMIGGAARSLGVVGPFVNYADAFRLLDQIAQKGGVIGAACRFAKQRLQASAGRATSASISSTRESAPAARSSSGSAPSSASSSEPAPASSAPAEAAQEGVSREEIAAIFAPTLGEEKARDLIARFAEKQHFGARGSVDQALGILEALALEPGIVGVTARFGKARLILRR